MELLAYLQKKYAVRISCEARFSPDQGSRIFTTFCAMHGKAEEPEWLRTQMSTAPDPPALISQMALGRVKVAICDQALSIFVSVFQGAESGNLCALNFMSTGGIFIVR